MGKVKDSTKQNTSKKKSKPKLLTKKGKVTKTKKTSIPKIKIKISSTKLDQVKKCVTKPNQVKKSVTKPNPAVKKCVSKPNLAVKKCVTKPNQVKKSVTKPKSTVKKLSANLKESLEPKQKPKKTSLKTKVSHDGKPSAKKPNKRKEKTSNNNVLIENKKQKLQSKPGTSPKAKKVYKARKRKEKELKTDPPLNFQGADVPVVSGKRKKKLSVSENLLQQTVDPSEKANPEDPPVGGKRKRKPSVCENPLQQTEDPSEKANPEKPPVEGKRKTKLSVSENLLQQTEDPSEKANPEEPTVGGKREEKLSVISKENLLQQTEVKDPSEKANPEEPPVEGKRKDEPRENIQDLTEMKDPSEKTIPEESPVEEHQEPDDGKSSLNSDDVDIELAIINDEEFFYVPTTAKSPGLEEDCKDTDLQAALDEDSTCKEASTIGNNVLNAVSVKQEPDDIHIEPSTVDNEIILLQDPEVLEQSVDPTAVLISLTRPPSPHSPSSLEEDPVVFEQAVDPTAVLTSLTSSPSSHTPSSLEEDPVVLEQAVDPTAVLTTLRSPSPHMPSSLKEDLNGSITLEPEGSSPRTTPSTNIEESTNEAKSLRDLNSSITSESKSSSPRIVPSTNIEDSTNEAKPLKDLNGIITSEPESSSPRKAPSTNIEDSTNEVKSLKDMNGVITSEPESSSPIIAPSTDIEDSTNEVKSLKDLNGSITLETDGSSPRTTPSTNIEDSSNDAKSLKDLHSSITLEPEVSPPRTPLSTNIEGSTDESKSLKDLNGSITLEPEVLSPRTSPSTNIEDSTKATKLLNDSCGSTLSETTGPLSPLKTPSRSLEDSTNDAKSLKDLNASITLEPEGSSLRTTPSTNIEDDLYLSSSISRHSSLDSVSSDSAFGLHDFNHRKRPRKRRRETSLSLSSSKRSSFYKPSQEPVFGRSDSHMSSSSTTSLLSSTENCQLRVMVEKLKTAEDEKVESKERDSVTACVENEDKKTANEETKQRNKGFSKKITYNNEELDLRSSSNEMKQESVINLTNNQVSDFKDLKVGISPVKMRQMQSAIVVVIKTPTKVPVLQKEEAPALLNKTTKDPEKMFIQKSSNHQVKSNVQSGEARKKVDMNLPPNIICNETLTSRKWLGGYQIDTEPENIRAEPRLESDSQLGTYDLLKMFLSEMNIWKSQKVLTKENGSEDKENEILLDYQKDFLLEVFQDVNDRISHLEIAPSTKDSLAGPPTKKNEFVSLLEDMMKKECSISAAEKNDLSIDYLMLPKKVISNSCSQPNKGKDSLVNSAQNTCYAFEELLDFEFDESFFPTGKGLTSPLQECSVVLTQLGDQQLPTIPGDNENKEFLSKKSSPEKRVSTAVIMEAPKTPEPRVSTAVTMEAPKTPEPRVSTAVTMEVPKTAPTTNQIKHTRVRSKPVLSKVALLRKNKYFIKENSLSGETKKPHPIVGILKNRDEIVPYEKPEVFIKDGTETVQRLSNNRILITKKLTSPLVPKCNTENLSHTRPNSEGTTGVFNNTINNQSKFQKRKEEQNELERILPPIAKSVKCDVSNGALRNVYKESLPHMKNNETPTNNQIQRKRITFCDEKDNLSFQKHSQNREHSPVKKPRYEKISFSEDKVDSSCKTSPQSNELSLKIDTTQSKTISSNRKIIKITNDPCSKKLLKSKKTTVVKEISRSNEIRQKGITFPFEEDNSSYQKNAHVPGGNFNNEDKSGINNRHTVFNGRGRGQVETFPSKKDHQFTIPRSVEASTHRASKLLGNVDLSCSTSHEDDDDTTSVLSIYVDPDLISEVEQVAVEPVISPVLRRDLGNYRLGNVSYNTKRPPISFKSQRKRKNKFDFIDEEESEEEEEEAQRKCNDVRDKHKSPVVNTHQVRTAITQTSSTTVANVSRSRGNMENYPSGNVFYNGKRSPSPQNKWRSKFNIGADNEKELEEEETQRRLEDVREECKSPVFTPNTSREMNYQTAVAQTSNTLVTKWMDGYCDQRRETSWSAAPSENLLGTSFDGYCLAYLRTSISKEPSRHLCDLKHEIPLIFYQSERHGEESSQRIASAIDTVIEKDFTNPPKEFLKEVVQFFCLKSHNNLIRLGEKLKDNISAGIDREKAMSVWKVFIDTFFSIKAAHYRNKQFENRNQSLNNILKGIFERNQTVLEKDHEDLSVVLECLAACSENKKEYYPIKVQFLNCVSFLENYPDFVYPVAFRLAVTNQVVEDISTLTVPIDINKTPCKFAYKVYKVLYKTNSSYSEIKRANAEVADRFADFLRNVFGKNIDSGSSAWESQERKKRSPVTGPGTGCRDRSQVPENREVDVNELIQLHSDPARLVKMLETKKDYLNETCKRQIFDTFRSLKDGRSHYQQMLLSSPDWLKVALNDVTMSFLMLEAEKGSWPACNDLCKHLLQFNPLTFKNFCSAGAAKPPAYYILMIILAQLKCSELMKVVELFIGYKLFQVSSSKWSIPADQECELLWQKICGDIPKGISSITSVDSQCEILEKIIPNLQTLETPINVVNTVAALVTQLLNQDKVRAAVSLVSVVSEAGLWRHLKLEHYNHYRMLIIAMVRGDELRLANFANFLFYKAKRRVSLYPLDFDKPTPNIVIKTSLSVEEIIMIIKLKLKSYDYSSNLKITFEPSSELIPQLHNLDCSIAGAMERFRYALTGLAPDARCIPKSEAGTLVVDRITLESYRQISVDE